MKKMIPFNKPTIAGNEEQYVLASMKSDKMSGDGAFTKKCHQWFENKLNCHKALLTTSCTHALDMAALLIDIEPGDEVIMPSYTFASTANAFVLRGGVPVFVDIREDTLNIDERLIESAITACTRAIVPVHYAGVACEMDTIMATAKQYGLQVIEDAAQGIMSTYKGRALGSISDLGVYSFHETKNVISGEGGALIVNTPALSARAEIIREKGTDRSRFFRGEVDKYTWQEVGSSFLPGELTAAFLFAQLEEAERITNDRLIIWNYYNELLEPLERKGFLRRPIIPNECQHNGHMYYVLLAPRIDRQIVLDVLNKNNINSVFHYVPLHSSPGGRRYGRAHGELEVTDRQSDRLIRLPLWVGLTSVQQQYIVDVLAYAIFNDQRSV